MIRLEHLPADVLALSPIARDALSGRLDPGLIHVPRRLDDLPEPPDLLEPRDRDNLVRALQRGLAPLEPHVAALDAVRSLGQPGVFAVVAGQQPGFLASPLYSLYKALQALRLAARLHERWERPVVALFWNHADDHDIAEVHSAYLVNRNLDLQKFALAGLSSGRQPLSKLVLDEEQHRIGPVRAALAQLVEGERFAERALEMFVPRSGETFARAFTRTITELLGPLGLIVLEPDWIRTEMSARLARIVALDPVSRLERGAGSVRDRGYSVAIEPASAALLFHHEPKGRRALRAGGDGFRYDGEDGSRTGVELASELVQTPLAWSAGALLRPIVQDLCLPVAAYVGGHGELAYHAELADLREALGAPATPFVPRISCTLVDPESRLALERSSLRVEDVLRQRGVFSAASPASDSPAVLAEVRAIAARAEHALDGQQDEMRELDPALAVQLKRTGDQVRALVEKLVEKAERVHQNKSGKSRRHERRLGNVLFPRGEPQERVLGPFAFVARYGEDWIRELADEIDPFGESHLAVHFASNGRPIDEGDE